MILVSYCSICLSANIQYIYIHIISSTKSFAYPHEAAVCRAEQNGMMMDESIPAVPPPPPSTTIYQRCCSTLSCLLATAQYTHRYRSEQSVVIETRQAEPRLGEYTEPVREVEGPKAHQTSCVVRYLQEQRQAHDEGDLLVDGSHAEQSQRPWV